MGAGATICPGWDRLGKAALNAALEPETWAPVAGAVIFQIDCFDRRVSNLASKRTPIFGSQNNANGASEYLQAASEGVALVTALATPSGAEPGDWATAKLKGLGVGIAAVALTEGATDALKYATNRTRPDKSGHDSFPSGHASRTAGCDTLASRNIDYLSLPVEAQYGLKAGFTTLTLMTAWARIEAKKHYPSDVLAGMALGHFLGAFVNDAFLGADSNPNLSLQVNPSGKDVMVAAQWQF